jgi:hypothetical protein
MSLPFVNTKSVGKKCFFERKKCTGWREEEKQKKLISSSPFLFYFSFVFLPFSTFRGQQGVEPNETKTER